MLATHPLSAPLGGHCGFRMLLHEHIVRLSSSHKCCGRSSISVSISISCRKGFHCTIRNPRFGSPGWSRREFSTLKFWSTAMEDYHATFLGFRPVGRRVCTEWDLAMTAEEPSSPLHAEDATRASARHRPSPWQNLPLPSRHARWDVHVTFVRAD